ncbi:MAG TPA: hypothetical protein DEG96_07655 [Candidatus Atribacteria bacterium]|nr:hypothetical protein [Candidatus Atribacteria bacterium]
MSEITRQKIFEKLQLLDGYLSNLKQLKKEIKSPEEFLEDFHLYGLAERYLQLSCQVVLDTLNLMIIEEACEKPEDNQEAVSILFRRKVISENLASGLEGMAGFRNILVHEYGEIDRKRVYQYLLEKLELFKDFKKEILNWLKNRSL